MSTRLPLFPALLAGLFAAGPVLAQGTPAPASTTAPTATAAAIQKRDTMVERRITQLHADLNITAQQQPQFDAFANAMRQNASEMDQFQADHASVTASGSAVDLLKTYASFTQMHAQEVQNLVGPFSALYDALSPEQKRVADRSFRTFARAQQQHDARVTHGS
jgi:hypothetical protein